MRKGFFAYPSDPSFIGESISQAVEELKSKHDIHITPWPLMNIQGLKLDNLIREHINDAEFLIADVTYPNFNVYYEVGYCIGMKKPVIPTINYSATQANRNVSLTGIFDTIGQIRYQNANELRDGIATADFKSWVASYIHDKNHTQPLFFLDSLRKTDFRNYITGSIVNSGVKMRSFDPSELPRLALNTAISEISSSAGVVIPLISDQFDDYERHNLRAAFLAGLSHGLEIEPLILQYEDLPAPIDFRDLISTTRTRREVEKAVEEYCQATLIRNQQRVSRSSKRKRTLLEQIDIGASAAENESERFDLYFIQTAEFARAMRTNGSIVTGRKGSGKSAIFYQVMAEKASDKRNLVVELNPASHNLSELREALLDVMSVGLFDHTIAAFWQYIIYAEILLKLREVLLPRAKNNLDLLKQIQEIEEKYNLTEDMVAADFTARLELAVRLVVGALEGVPSAKDARESLTNILFERQIPALRDTIAQLCGGLENIILLFDNLDKGWPARRVEEQDVRMVRHLVGALDKIQRELEKKSTKFQYLLFLRSDVYERLVEETSDRGKYNIIKVDWSDALQLERLIRERVISSVAEGDEIAAWNAVNPVLEGNSKAIESMIESSLMRPRFLIDLCEKALSFAINRGHTTVEASDVEDALAQHSMYLVSDFAYEIQQVEGISEDIFYHFLGEGDVLTQDKVCEIIERAEKKVSSAEMISILMWYGFLGIPDNNDQPIYIYDRAYDMRRFEAERTRLGTNIRYFINPAFLRGL